MQDHDKLNSRGYRRRISSPIASYFSSLLPRLARTDRILLLTLVLSFFSGINGLTWGWYGCLNPDAMAFRSIGTSPPFHPGNFDKPPLLPYINNVLINEPSKWVGQVAVFFGANKHNTESARQHWRMILSRFLQASFYAGIIIFAFLFAREWFGQASARVIAILLATCSGLVPYKIFLTTDLPLAFFMTACLYFSGRIMKSPNSVKISLTAGACAGLATAMKYNGLGVAIVLPLAHFLAPGGFLSAWKRRSFYLAGLAVPATFILANPYSVLDAKKFTADFMFNYIVTPVYDGETGHGYGRFFAQFPDLLGWPLTYLLPILLGISLLTLIERGRSCERCAMVLLLSVFGLYYWKIGGFARIETRFVMPVVPFVLLMTAPAWQWMARWRGLLLPCVFPLAAYGLVSGWFVGKVFSEDARMEAISWARVNFPSQASVEAENSPDWRWLEDKKITHKKFPVGIQRNKVFSEVFADNAWVKGRVADEQKDNPASFFTFEALQARNPDFITFTDRAALNVATGPYLKELLTGKFGYHVVFDKVTPAPPRWAYPQQPDFTRVHFWIMARD